jgi:hypothetical protein
MENYKDIDEDLKEYIKNEKREKSIQDLLNEHTKLQ